MAQSRGAPGYAWARVDATHGAPRAVAFGGLLRLGTPGNAKARSAKKRR